MWGIYDDSDRMSARRYRMDGDMKRLNKNLFNEPFVTYVYGEENFNMLSKNFNCVLMDKEPFAFDLQKEQYRHKLEILLRCMEDFDEIVFLDWDCVPTKKLPTDFWETLGKKEKIQANLQQYHTRKCYWRKNDWRKLSNAGFVYIRDKSIPQVIIDNWNRLPGPSAEPALSKCIDDIGGGWQGIDYYWTHFEPDFCNIHKSSCFQKKLLNTKNECFIHSQGGPSSPKYVR